MNWLKFSLNLKSVLRKMMECKLHILIFLWEHFVCKLKLYSVEKKIKTHQAKQFHQKNQEKIIILNTIWVLKHSRIYKLRQLYTENKKKMDGSCDIQLLLSISGSLSASELELTARSPAMATRAYSSLSIDLQKCMAYFNFCCKTCWSWGVK